MLLNTVSTWREQRVGRDSSSRRLGPARRPRGRVPRLVLRDSAATESGGYPLAGASGQGSDQGKKIWRSSIGPAPLVLDLQPGSPAEPSWVAALEADRAIVAAMTKSPVTIMRMVFLG